MGSLIFQTFKEKIISNLYSLFQKIEKDEMLLNSFYKAQSSSVTQLCPTLCQDVPTEKKWHVQLSGRLHSVFLLEQMWWWRTKQHWDHGEPLHRAQQGQDTRGRTLALPSVPPACGCWVGQNHVPAWFQPLILGFVTTVTRACNQHSHGQRPEGDRHKRLRAYCCALIQFSKRRRKSRFFLWGGWLC